MRKEERSIVAGVKMTSHVQNASYSVPEMALEFLPKRFPPEIRIPNGGAHKDPSEDPFQDFTMAAAKAPDFIDKRAKAGCHFSKIWFIMAGFDNLRASSQSVRIGEAQQA